MIRVRNISPEDQSRARALIESGLGDHFGHVDSARNPDLDDILATYVEVGHRFYVAEDGGRLVGTAGLVLEESAARMVRVSVCRTRRRSGIATALLERCVEDARGLGHPWLVAHTQPEWPDSMGFYASRGFVPFGRDDVDVHLRLSLGPA